MNRYSSTALVVAQGGADQVVVVDLIRGLSLLEARFDLRVVVRSPADQQAIEKLAIGPANSVLVISASSGTVDLRLPATTQTVGMFPADNAVDAVSVDRSLQMLHTNSELVLAAFGRNASPHHLGTTTEPQVVDGRTFARDTLFGHGLMTSPLPSVLFRIGALRDVLSGALAHWPVEFGAYWSTVLRLLCEASVRGPAWVEPRLANEMTPTMLEETSLWDRRPEIFASASALGLLDQPGDRARAMVQLTRQAAALLRSGTSQQNPFRPPNESDIVRRIVSYWKSLTDHEPTEAPLLPLHAVILDEGVASRLAVTQASVDHVVQQITIVTHDPGSDAAQTSPLLMNDRLVDHPGLRTQIGESTLPVLAMRAGEELEICDHFQLDTLLEAANPPSAARVTTPHGDQIRLVWPRSTTSDLDQSDVTIKRSLRLLVPHSDTKRDWLPRPIARRESYGLRKFIIIAPDYTEAHGGVVALHRLCDRLNAIGYEAYLEPIGATGKTHSGWSTPLRRGRSLDDAVVIYPEIVTGNLLGTARVVRWLLNRPAWFTGSDMEEGADDLIVTFNSQISPDHPVLNVPLIDPTVFFPKDRPGVGTLLWIGKGKLPQSFDRSDTTLVTSTWPMSRVALASLLRRASVLYTCDWLTSLIDEALMCGTPVVLLGEQTWARGDVSLRSGMTWDDGDDLIAASKQVGDYFPIYMDSLRSIDTDIEAFVRLVNDHFARINLT